MTAPPRLHPMTGSRAAAVLLASLAIAWPVRSAAQEPAVGPPLRPLVLESPAGQRFRVVPIATGLEHPWSLAFLPGGRTMLVTERPGRLRLIRDDGLDPRPIAGVPDVYAEHIGGLNEVALHPEFARNGLVYLSYSKAGERGATLALARGRFDGTQLVDVHDIFVADAWEPAGPTTRGGGGTYGGRMAFGPDGMLYLTVADRDTMVLTGNPEVRMRAQNLGDHVGKILRLRDDGSVPDDNPFVGQPGARPEIYTYGHRNAYGLAFHPDTGALWELEIGPLAGDEVNILVPGGNYGWPLVSLGRDYSGQFVSEQPWWRPGIEMPLIFWVPAISPSGMVFYTGDRFPAWQGSLFVSALGARQLQRIVFNDGMPIGRPESLLTEIGQRFRDVRQGPNGYLYVLTEGRVTGDDALGAVLRIEPAE